VIPKTSKALIRLLLVASCSALATDAMAWSDEGHKIVAAIAYARLTPATRKTVDEILKADEDKLTAPDFVSRATWADRYRDADRDGAKKQYNATRQWHFVDIEIEGGTLDEACFGHPPLPAGTRASAGPAKACVVDKIEQFTAELRNPATIKAERVLALKFLLHFVGDLHQPLHAADHQGSGGNAVPVHYGHLTEPDKLHAYWDRHLVEMLGTDPKKVAANLNAAITDAQAGQWSSGSPADWAKESFEKAKTVAYNFDGEASFVDGQGHTGAHLDAIYEARALPVVMEQLSKAGVRLATILNGLH
jgi:hypothetical protein